jgi:hypothetical protein
LIIFAFCEIINIAIGKGVIFMGKAIFTVVVTLIVGIVCAAIGNDFFNGFIALGPISAISVMGGLMVYFNQNKK